MGALPAERAQLLHQLDSTRCKRTKYIVWNTQAIADTYLHLTFQEGEASQQAHVLLRRSFPWQLPSYT